MSLQSRYDNLVKDMLNLLQQALYRHFLNKEIDVTKFKQYFCNFHKSMITLEQQFHQSRIKISKSVSKLTQLFIHNHPQANNTFTSTPIKNLQPSLSINKPKTTLNSQSSNSRNVPLNVIGEVEEDSIIIEQFQRRSGTAEGSRRNKNFVIQFGQNGRPKTGNYRSSDRYSGKRRTISYNDSQSRSRDLSQNIYDQRQSIGERKALYDELEKEGKAQIFYQNLIKIPKKKRLNTNRWSFKINKLI